MPCAWTKTVLCFVNDLSFKPKVYTMEPVYLLIIQVIDLYKFAIFIWIIAGWLIHFGVLNTSNRLVGEVFRFLNKICEPPMRWVQRFLPTIGGFDLSPIVVLLGLEFLSNMIVHWLLNGALAKALMSSPL